MLAHARACTRITTASQQTISKHGQVSSPGQPDSPTTQNTKAEKEGPEQG